MEGLHDPVAVGPGRESHVGMVSPSVGVAGSVEPIERHVLAISRGREECLDRFFLRGCGIGCEVIFKLIELGESGRQSGEVEADATEPAGWVGRGRGHE